MIKGACERKMGRSPHTGAHCQWPLESCWRRGWEVVPAGWAPPCSEQEGAEGYSRQMRRGGHTENRKWNCECSRRIPEPSPGAGGSTPLVPRRGSREHARCAPQDAGSAGRRGPGTCISNQFPGEATLLARRPCLGNYCCYMACPGHPS